MRRTAQILAATVIVPLLLVGCGVLELNAPDFSVSMDPAPLGYEADGLSITIETRQLSFRNAPGALGATVEGFDVAYLDDAGDVIGEGRTEGLGVFVPAGITCEEPDPELGCTLQSQGAAFGPGPVAQSQPVQLLDGAIAVAHLEEYIDFLDGNRDAPVNWRARLTFFGSTTTGADFEIVKTFKITPPN